MFSPDALSPVQQNLRRKSSKKKKGTGAKAQTKKIANELKELKAALAEAGIVLPR